MIIHAHGVLIVLGVLALTKYPIDRDCHLRITRELAARAAERPVTIRGVKSKRDLKTFIQLPWALYKGNSAWVPPLRSEMKKILNPETNHFLRSGPYRLFLALRDSKPAGRLLAGIDRKTNAAKGGNEGYIALFESVPDYGTARRLLDAACGTQDYGFALFCSLCRPGVSPERSIRRHLSPDL